MTDWLHLSAKHRRILEALLREHLPGVEVWAYGSRVNGRSHDGSDLDLVLRGPGLEKIATEQLADFEEAVRESTIPFLVEAQDWARLPERFHREIEREHVVLVGCSGDPIWGSIPFASAAKLIRDTVSPDDLNNQPYIGLEHIGENTLSLTGVGIASNAKSAKSQFAQGDILFGKLRPYFRKVVRARMDGVCSTDIWVVRSAPGVDQGYLYYVMASPDFVDYAVRGSEGTKMPRAKWEFVAHYTTPFPSLSEQRAIAHVLGTLDDKIELNRCMNETLESMAQALFKSWFVDFDPIRVKMAGRDTGLPPCLASVFPDSLAGSEYGEIPNGWTHSSISNFANVVYGAPFASSQFIDAKKGVPLIRIRDLATYEPSVSTKEIHPKGHLIVPGDLVVGMDGEFRLHVWKGPSAWLNQRVCHFEPKSDVPKAYLAEALKEPLAFFERSKVGTTVIHLGKSDIDTICFIHPNQSCLTAFGTYVGPLLERTVANAIESRTLAQCRDLLLPKLISGEIRIQDAERIVEAVT